MSRTPARRAVRPAARQAAGPPATPVALVRACLAMPFAAFAVLAWSLRGAPLGTAVADDFGFLARLAFQHPLDPFDSMGAAFYWRPLSRQVWYSALGPVLERAPWLAAALQLALLAALALLLYRLARRIAPRGVAALVATAPLLAEPVRVLIGWPSGVQHLLAAAGLALALHEALAGRRLTAVLAALGAALAHEWGVAGFLLVPLGAYARDGATGTRRVLPWTALAALAWAAGYRLALAHGVRLPASGPAHAVAALPATLARIVVAALNAETLPGQTAGLVVAGLAGLIGAAVLALQFAPRRPRLGATGRVAALGCALVVLGALPLAGLLPDWNAWRAFAPVVALAAVATLVAAGTHPALGLAFVLLRAGTLLAAEPAGPVTLIPPAAVSDISFARLARLQNIVHGTHTAFAEAELPRNPGVFYWGLPQMSLVGFQDDVALEVWRRDSTQRFHAFGNHWQDVRWPDLLLAYDTRPGRALVVPVTRTVLAPLAAALTADNANDMPRADSLYRAALALQQPEVPSLSATVLQNLAMLAVKRGRFAEAESLNDRSLLIRGLNPNGVALRALIALERGNAGLAREQALVCLSYEPANAVALQVLAEANRRLGRPR